MLAINRSLANLLALPDPLQHALLVEENGEERQAHAKEYTAYMYPNLNHGFHNDTTPRYDDAGARLAWKRTIDFFDAKLT